MGIHIPPPRDFTPREDPEKAQLLHDLAVIANDLVELSAAWCDLHVAGLPLPVARSLIRAEIERLTALSQARRDGL